MSTTTTFSVRMESNLKKQCEELYGELGLNLTTAINVFLRKSLSVGGFPFDVRMASSQRATIEAMQEAVALSKDPNVTYYTDIEEALQELKK